MDFNVPEGLMNDALNVLAKSKEKGKIRIGINEVTKAVEREIAKLVLVANDVEPKEIVMHIPLICDEKKIPYCCLPHCRGNLVIPSRPDPGR